MLRDIRSSLKMSTTLTPPASMYRIRACSPGRFMVLPENAGSVKWPASTHPSAAFLRIWSRQTASWLSQESNRPPTWLSVDTRV